MPRAVFLPPQTVLAIAPDRFARFLAAHDAPPEALVAIAAGGGMPSARALFGAQVGDGTADGVELLGRLASRDGKRGILDAAAALPVSLADVRALSPANFAAEVLTLRARETEPRMRRIVKRAVLALAELGESFFAYELVAREPARAHPRAKAEPELAAFVRARGAEGELWLREDEATGAFDLAFLSRGDACDAVEHDPKLGFVRRDFAPMRFDRALLDVSGGRVSIWTDEPQDVGAIAAAVGRAFFGDATFFSDRPAFTTKPLEALGLTGLAAVRLPWPLTRVRVIACTRELIGEGRQRATGSRALALLRHTALAGGYLPDVTLRFDVAGEEIPVDVEVRLPGRFACSSSRWQNVIREAMGALGMLAPGSLADDAWSLFPVRHAEWRLREVLGSAEVDALLARGALARVLSRNVTTRALRGQGSNLLTFPIPGEPGISYAIPTDPSIAPRDVSEPEREVLELDLAKLAVLRAEEMKLAGTPYVRDGGIGIVHGSLPARTASLHFVSILRAPDDPAEREALVREILADAFPAHVVLLVPRGRTWGSGLLEVEYDGLVAGGIVLVERAVKLARLEDDVDLSRLTHAPLVLHPKTRRMWLHGVAITLPDSGWAMLEGLALRAGEIATTKEVCKWISPAREDLQAAKATRAKLVKWLATAFEDAGKRPPLEEIERVVVVEGKRGYRLGVAVRVF